MIRRRRWKPTVETNGVIPRSSLVKPVGRRLNFPPRCRPGGGIGRHRGFKIPRPFKAIPVRVRSRVLFSWRRRCPFLRTDHHRWGEIDGGVNLLCRPFLNAAALKRGYHPRDALVFHRLPAKLQGDDERSPAVVACNRSWGRQNVHSTLLIVVVRRLEKRLDCVGNLRTHHPS